MNHFRSRITYANVVATLALFIALGGTSYAALTVTGAAVKDGTLTSVDVKDSSLSGLDIKNGSLGTLDLSPTTRLALKGARGDRGAEGDQGAQGSSGTQGPQGFTGAQGVQGPVGLQGRPGMVWRGPWHIVGVYSVDDTVSYAGATYIATLPGSGAEPGTVTGQAYWSLVASKGDTGATGQQGPTGLTGAVGPQGPVGLTGPQGPQGLKGDTGNVGPQGPTGLTGPQGPQGDTGLTGAAGTQGPAGPGLGTIRSYTQIFATNVSMGPFVVTCPAGSYAVGGGVRKDASARNIRSSHSNVIPPSGNPDPQGQQPTGWSITLDALGTAVLVEVICAEQA